MREYPADDEVVSQIETLRTALLAWVISTVELVELAENAERAAVHTNPETDVRNGTDESQLQRGLDAVLASKGIQASSGAGRSWTPFTRLAIGSQKGRYHRAGQPLRACRTPSRTQCNGKPLGQGIVATMRH
jgi:hypothetical protein